MHVVLIGATGNLGRPVARVLAADDRFELSAVVRDPARARARLPDSIRLVNGDLRDAAAIAAALEGADAVYLNLSNPPSARTPFDPDRDGTRTVLAAAQAAGVRRIARISALVANDADDPWFVIQRKCEIDREIMDAGLEWVIFRPTWYMESLAMFLMGPLLIEPLAPDVPLRWIAGEDYGRMVAEALVRDDAANRMYTVQGPEAVTFRNAFRRFRTAYSGRALRVPALLPAMRVAGLVSANAKYSIDLFRTTFGQGDDFVSDAAWDLAGPTMTIEDYARSIAKTGDVPSKL